MHGDLYSHRCATLRLTVELQGRKEKVKNVPGFIKNRSKKQCNTNKQMLLLFKVQIVQLSLTL